MWPMLLFIIPGPLCLVSSSRVKGLRASSHPRNAGCQKGLFSFGSLPPRQTRTSEQTAVLVLAAGRAHCLGGPGLGGHGSARTLREQGQWEHQRPALCREPGQVSAVEWSPSLWASPSCLPACPASPGRAGLPARGAASVSCARLGWREPRWEAAAAAAAQSRRPGPCSGRLSGPPNPRPVCRPVLGRDSLVRTERHVWETTLPSLEPCSLNSSASLPHVISRMGKLEQVDVNLFCLVATDFYRHQIEEELDRRAFQSVFEVVAAPGNPYHRLLTCLRNVHKVATC